MDIEELLARAWKAVEQSGVPEPLQELAFKEALLRLGGSVVPRAEHKRDDQSGDEPPGSSLEASTPIDLSDVWSKFSNESGVAVDDLQRLFWLGEDGTPHINGPRSKLGKTASEQARAVAVALTAAFDYLSDTTPIAETIVKAEATRLKIDVGRNWASSVGGVIQGVSWTGPARQKMFKTSNSTPEALKKVVASYLGTPTE